MSLTELGQVLGPSIYVWDCCQAGLIVEKFFECNDASALPAFHFAACGRNEYRPMRFFLKFYFLKIVLLQKEPISPPISSPHV